MIESAIGGAVRGVGGPAVGLEAAGTVGARLRADLRAVIGSFPAECRSPTRAAQWLKLSRPVCQRLIGATRGGGSPIETLRRLPGLQALAGFVDSVEQRGVPAELVASLASSVQAYAALLDTAGGSRADLIRALDGAEAGALPPDEHRSRDAGATPDDRPALRRAAFEANRQLLRREYGAQIGVFVYAPSADNPGGVDCITSLGLCGVRLRPGALPVCPIGWFTIAGSDEPRPEDQLVAPGRKSIPGLPVSILTDFSSTPCPRVIPRRSGSRVTALVESATNDDAPFDLFLATRLNSAAHPGAGKPPVQRAFLIDGGPSRALGIVVLLHRSLAQQSVQGSGLFVRHDAVMANHAGAAMESPEDRWQDRLPDAPALECLGKNFLEHRFAAMPRMPDLLRTVLEMGGYDAAEFVGYRIETVFPIWNAPYVLWMDFRPFDEPDNDLSEGGDPPSR